MRKILLLIVALCITIQLSGNSNYYYRSLGIDKGLSHATVTSIISNDRGLLWVGTAFGLNVYNGHEIKSYFHKKEIPHSLPSNYILFLAEDAQKNIWVSTRNGLVKYDQKKDGFFAPLPEEPVRAYSECRIPDGILFGGDKKLYRYDYRNRTFCQMALKGEMSGVVSYIGEWEKGVYLLIFSDGMIRLLDYANATVYPSAFARQTSRVAAAYIDDERNVYLSVSQQGLYIFDKNGKKKHHLTAENSLLTYDLILDMKEKDGKLWMTTDGGGINILNLKSPTDITSITHLSGDASSIPTNSMDCLYKDTQGNMWAGSIREGVIEIREAFIHTYRNVMPGNKYGLSNQSVISLCQDKQNFIWIGTDGGGLNRFNPHDQTFVHYPSTYNEKILSVVDYSPTELLLLYYLKNPCLFNKQTGRCSPYQLPDVKSRNTVERIYKIDDERFLFLANRPYIYDRRADRCHYFVFSDAIGNFEMMKPVGITADCLYLQGENTLMKADLKSYAVDLLFKVDEQENVQVAAYDPGGVLWIGTDCGLRSYHLSTGEYRKIETGLFDRVSALIPEDGKRVWIGAQNAFFSYDIKEKRFFVWGESDGFLPNELLNVFQPPVLGDNIYLGGSHGLVQVDKTSKTVSEVQTELRLADVVVDGVSVIHKGHFAYKTEFGLVVPWDYKLLQIRVVSIDKDVFGKKLFKYSISKYSLQGSESKTIETYSPTLPLDMLSPGEYFVHVSVYTKNGIWSTPTSVLHLNVIAPWYKDYRIIMGTIALIIALFVWRLFIYLQEKEERMKWRMNEMVQKADREKIQFLINISHELRTPLTLIYAPLKRMMEIVSGTAGVTVEQQTFLKRQLINIHKSASHMKSIINMTLDVNRMSDKEDAMHICPHKLNEWIVSVAEEFEYEFEVKNITLNYCLDEKITQFGFDDRKCDAVLSNLLMNALKFSPQHSEITIKSQLNEGEIRVSVSDEGIGLNNLDVTRLFTRFYQGEHSEQGSGIGLFYSRILVEKQGGTIGAFSNPDKGATFYFELPFCSEKERTNEYELETEQQVPLLGEALPDLEDEEFSVRPYTVMVVEDNPDLRNYLVEMLGNDFGTVRTASNGAEAYETIAEKMPDIVISDIMMPLMDGYELCRKIKSETLTCHIPVVLLTARGDSQSTLTGYKLGADAYLPKPFELDFLLTVLRNLLKNRENMKQKFRDSFVQLMNDDLPLSATSNDEEFLSKLNKLILDHLSSAELNVTYMTEQMGMSRSALYAKLKALTNMGVNDYINRIKIDKASRLLIASGLSVTEISEAVGFEYQKYFSTLFKQLKGVTPTQYRQQNSDKQVSQSK